MSMNIPMCILFYKQPYNQSSEIPSTQAFIIIEMNALYIIEFQQLINQNTVNYRRG